MNPVYPFSPFKSVRATRGAGRSLPGWIKKSAGINSMRPAPAAPLVSAPVFPADFSPTFTTEGPRQTFRPKTLSA
jgi:hypothetical protein